MASEDEERAKKRQKLDYKDTLSILVGPEEISYVVHQQLLCSKSPFFKKATRSIRTNARSNTFRLAETRTDIFEVYIHWIHSSNLDMSFVKEPPNTRHSPSFQALAELWIFADKMLDLDLCNEIANKTVSIAKSLKPIVSEHTLSYIWGHTNKASPLRKLHTDIFTTYRRSSSCFEGHIDEYPQDLVRDLATRHMRETKQHLLTRVDSKGDNVCTRYHVHDENHSCSLQDNAEQHASQSGDTGADKN